MTIETQDLNLVIDSLEAAQERIGALPAEHREQISAEWLTLLENATEGDPWILGFRLVRRSDGAEVGQCGFKGPPDIAGTVEVSYYVASEFEGRGYATQAAEALTRFAMADGRVQTVCAHTLPEQNASTRILKKCGFKHVGEVVDPDDGPVWRWEKHADTA